MRNRYLARRRDTPHEWFFQTAAIAGVWAVANLVLGWPEGALGVGLIALAALMLGAYTLRRSRRLDRRG